MIFQFSWLSQPGVINVINMIYTILDIVRIVVPIALIIMTTIDITKKVINPEDKEGQKKIMTRAIAALIVFLIPLFISILFKFFDIDINNLSPGPSGNNNTPAPTVRPTTVPTVKPILTPTPYNNCTYYIKSKCEINEGVTCYKDYNGCWVPNNVTPTPTPIITPSPTPVINCTYSTKSKCEKTEGVTCYQDYNGCWVPNNVTPTPTPRPTSTPSPTPRPTNTPRVTSTPSPTPRPTATPSPTPTSSPTPTPSIKCSPYNRPYLVDVSGQFCNDKYSNYIELLMGAENRMKNGNSFYRYYGCLNGSSSGKYNVYECMNDN